MNMSFLWQSCAFVGLLFHSSLVSAYRAGIDTPNCRRHVVKPAPSSVDSLGAAIESDLLASGFDPGHRTEETIHIDRGRLPGCKRFSNAGCSGPCRGCMKSRWLTISSNSWSVRPKTKDAAILQFTAPLAAKHRWARAF